MAEYGPTVLVKFATCSQDARSIFNKAALEAYGFNHEEAIRLFENCLRLDSKCTMAHYFIAHCYAPNYNNPTGLDSSKSYQHAQKALALLQADKSFSDIELALVEAQARRFCSPESSTPKDELLTRNYVNAMRDVFKNTIVIQMLSLCLLSR